MAGGAPGELGRHYLERTDGTVVPMAGADSVDAFTGDVLVLATPGGGGYGEVANEHADPTIAMPRRGFL
jgi:5-oxoprolinase (ATP-hydrolysing)